MTPTDTLIYETDDGTSRSAVDIWVVLPAMYEAAVEQVRAAQARGEEDWSYPALVQDNYAPKWEIDYSAVNWRIWPGFMNRTLGLTGFMYWAVDYWTDDPWWDVNIDLDETGQYVWPPGDGMLFYPGEQVGMPGALIPSIRAKWARDGFEDYEYAAILAGRGQAMLADRIVDSTATGWRD